MHDAVLKLRGAGEEDRGGQHTRVPPLMGLALSSALPPSPARWLEAACGPDQALSLLGQPGPDSIIDTHLFICPCGGRKDSETWSAALPSWLSPGMHSRIYYHICGELHFDFLKSPSSQIFSLSLMVFKAVAEGKPWLSPWFSASFSTLFPSQSPVFLAGVSAETPGDQLKPGRKRIGSYLGNKVPACHPGEGEAVQREPSFPFLRGTSSNRGGLCFEVPTVAHPGVLPASSVSLTSQLSSETQRENVFGGQQVGTWLY